MLFNLKDGISIQFYDYCRNDDYTHIFKNEEDDKDVFARPISIFIDTPEIKDRHGYTSISEIVTYVDRLRAEIKKLTDLRASQVKDLTECLLVPDHFYNKQIDDRTLWINVLKTLVEQYVYVIRFLKNM